MAKEIDPQRVIEQTLELRSNGTAWAARRAVGDAVLILLRDRELNRDTLLEQLQRMAAGGLAGWDGTPEAAARAAELILAPPAELPKWD